MTGMAQRVSPDWETGLREWTAQTSSAAAQACRRWERGGMRQFASLPWRSRYTGVMRLVLLLAMMAAPLCAEFLTVRMEVSNMDCATCVQSLEMGLKRIRGVEKVTVGPQNSVDFVLQAGNKVTLERLRDAIKGVGFTPGTAHVVAKGKALTSEGQWRFEVDVLAKVYNLAATSTETIQALRAKDGTPITVKAKSPAPPDPRTMPSLDVELLVEGK